jgi:hypothetical protein
MHSSKSDLEFDFLRSQVFARNRPHRAPASARGQPHLRRDVGGLRGAPDAFDEHPARMFGAFDAVFRSACARPLRNGDVYAGVQVIDPMWWNASQYNG